MTGWSATEIGWPALLTDHAHQGGSTEGNRGISFPDLLWRGSAEAETYLIYVFVLYCIIIVN